MNRMATLVTLGAIDPATSQKESDYGTRSLSIIFEMGHHSIEYIFSLEFLRQFTYKYVWYRGHLFVKNVRTIIFYFLEFVRLPWYNNVLKS